MIEITSVSDMRRWRDEQRQEGRRVGFVPTMGYLHKGHLQLIDRARAQTDAVLVSIFVNPTQFGPGEDFTRYPRDLVRDRELARTRGTSCVFAPDTAEIYPGTAAIGLTPGPLGDVLCGPYRPGHFAGVLLVVLKLFNITQPDVAVFGRKDAQQAVLVQRLIEDLNLPIVLDVAPTVREADGLALSSRNVYLDPAERAAAATIPRALDAGHRAYVSGVGDAGAIVATALEVLAAEPRLDVEYVELVSSRALDPASVPADDSILALAARVGGTRLIDNILLGSGTTGDVFLND